MFKKALTPSFIALVAATAVLSGCFPEEDSCNIKTAGIYVEYEAIEQNGGAVGKVTFWTGDSAGGTNLVLGDCGDAIAVNGVELDHHTGEPDYYQANIDQAEVYDFVFSREDEDTYSSTVSCREAVTSVDPDGGEFSRAADFDITWDNNDSGQIELLIDGSCIWDYPDVLGDTIADNGSHSVPANGIEAVDPDSQDTCAVAITLTRESDGDLNSSLKGTIVGKSVGASSFTSTP